MKNLKTFLLALAAVFIISSCGDDDMYFSEDIIVGDIITLDQSKIGDKIALTVGGRQKINVQKAKGNVTATPVDESITAK